MVVVKKSNAHAQIDRATRRQSEGNREARTLTLLAACITLAAASWFAFDHSSALRPESARQVMAGLAPQ